MWETAVLGPHTPCSLLNTMRLNNSLHFGLRGTTEQHNLRWLSLFYQNEFFQSLVIAQITCAFFLRKATLTILFETNKNLETVFNAEKLVSNKIIDE